MRAIKAVDEGEDRLALVFAELFSGILLFSWLLCLDFGLTRVRKPCLSFVSWLTFPISPDTRVSLRPLGAGHWPHLLLLLLPGLEHEPRGFLRLRPPVLGHVPDEERPNGRRTPW